MKTLKLWEASVPVIPTTTVWLLNDLAEFKGKQELFTKQSPQKLKVLKDMRDNGDVKCVGRGKLAQWKSLSCNR